MKRNKKRGPYKPSKQKLEYDANPRMCCLCGNKIDWNSFKYNKSKIKYCSLKCSATDLYQKLNPA